MKKHLQLEEAFEHIHVFSKQSVIFDLLGPPHNDQGSLWCYCIDEGAQRTELKIEFKAGNVVRAMCEKALTST
jgi:hypothetical protein